MRSFPTYSSENNSMTYKCQSTGNNVCMLINAVRKVCFIGHTLKMVLALIFHIVKSIFDTYLFSLNQNSLQSI